MNGHGQGLLRPTCHLRYAWWTDIQTFAIILRWVESYRLGMGHAPLSNLYESLIFFAWTIILLYMIIELRTKTRTLGPL